MSHQRFPGIGVLAEQVELHLGHAVLRSAAARVTGVTPNATIW